MTGIALGCIADDFTGATDLANNLVRAGLRVVQTIGVPRRPVRDADAVVIALKSRTAPVAEAVSASLGAATWLQAQGARCLYFKVCSTFDSTHKGNIGPVAEALADLVGARFVPVAPAFPANGRTVFQGHLFVGDQLLSESPMRTHPLTPMTDANLMRVLQPQLASRRVGLVARQHLAGGAAAVHERAGNLAEQGVQMAIVDTVEQPDLAVLAAAVVQGNWPLVVAGSGLAIELPGAMGLKRHSQADALPATDGARAIVSGSCSAATNAQVAAFMARGGSAFAIDGLRLAAGADALVDEALAWAAAHLGAQPVLFYATAQAETVRSVQQALGVERAGELIEQALARIARGLVDRGVRQLVVAGGETSGACVKALGIEQLRIGAQIDPGVPWCHADPPGLRIALKSGNFGGTDFFHKAFATT
jgi:3-dehydrotetronate 4-kinase